MGRLTLDWLNIIALLGAVQGLILAGVLFVRQRNRTANRVLAVAMIAFTIYLLTAVYHAAQLEEQLPWFFGWAYPMPLLYGPLIYLYAVTASDSSRRLTWRDALHFAPFAVCVVSALPIYLLSGPEKLAFYHGLQRGEVPVTIRLFDPIKMISGVTYATVTLLYLRKHRRRIQHNYSSLERVNLQWLVRLAAGAAAIWAMAVVFDVTQLVKGSTLARSEDYISLGIALLVYLIGYMALRQGEIVRFDTAEYPVPVPEPEPSAAAAAPTAEAQSGPRYDRSGLSEREAANLKNALLAAMERERPYKDSELTLADLARRLSTTPHKLSEVLNSHVQQTFYDFVNGYRVRDVQSRIDGGDANNLTILSLALDAGFASKSTFNDVFKKHTGRTPSDYRRSVSL